MGGNQNATFGNRVARSKYVHVFHAYPVISWQCGGLQSYFVTQLLECGGYVVGTFFVGIGIGNSRTEVALLHNRLVSVFDVELRHVNGVVSCSIGFVFAFVGMQSESNG